MVEKNQTLIIGANGMLGTDLAKIFSSSNLVLWTSKDLDITDKKTVSDKIKKLKPAIIINAAAYTNVDDCEKNRLKAMKVNGEGPGNLAKICQAIGAILVHYSTDYIFNGQKSNGYDENETQIDPINVYGESKALGEKLIKQNCQKYYIIRTAWLYGKKGKNFVDTIIKLSQEKKEIKVVNDQFGNPTYSVDLAKRTKEIINNIKPDYGIYHITNSGSCTWFDFAKKIIEQKKISCQIIPCASTDFPRPAKRPAFSILNNTKLPLMRTWQEALQDYLPY